MTVTFFTGAQTRKKTQKDPVRGYQGPAFRTRFSNSIARLGACMRAIMRRPSMDLFDNCETTFRLVGCLSSLAISRQRTVGSPAAAYMPAKFAFFNGTCSKPERTESPRCRTTLIIAAALAALSVPLSALTLDETLLAVSQADSPAAKIEFRWDPFFQAGVFSLGDHYAEFFAGAEPGASGLLLLDDREIYTVSLPYTDRGELFFPDAFTESLKNAFTRLIEDDASRFRIAAIIIDPGHGGKDPGAVSAGNFMINGKSQKAVEKDIVLDVSKRLKEVLARAFPGKRILMTRDRDTFPSLAERTSIANSVPLRDNEAIIYISIHANKAFNHNTRGYEVWYLPSDFQRELLDPSKYTDSADILPILNDMLQEEFTTESILMGTSILNAFGETLGPSVPSRGLKAQDWYVVRNSRMPAVLVELGFLDNKDDAALMTTESGLKKFTGALYKGIAEFIGVFERSGGFTAVR